ncbi:MAG: hypothetical protein U0L26_14160 [Cellulosilyticum sp.]|nr:hypothetical protein [Cellulosilyticum sp.]MEE1073499.1 hypothetical protein [Cellulosilyticum sp.]
MDCKEYADASSCFEKTKAYKHLVIAYAKQGSYGKALELADEKGLYELGAKIALHIQDLRQAAYFYSFFEPSRAAKLYRDLACYYEAGYCYLTLYDALSAIDMFRRCRNKAQRLRGFKEVSDYALVLYFTKDYSSAFRIFIALDDFYSALECAIKLKENELISSCKLLIGYDEANKHHYHFAAQCLESFTPQRALCFYAKAGDYEAQINLLLQLGEYEKAIQVCILHNNLNKAYEIASIYNPELLSS